MENLDPRQSKSSKMLMNRFLTSPDFFSKTSNSSTQRPIPKHGTEVNINYSVKRIPYLPAEFSL